MSKIDEFKTFVKTKPSLISFVRNGDMTWQKFYELWDLYGPSHDEWNKYATAVVENTSSKAAAFGLGDIIGMIKKMDMESLQKNISGIQKAIGLIQDMSSKGESTTDAVSTKNTYTPRPIFRRFED